MLLLAADAARADSFEAQWSLRPWTGLTRTQEPAAVAWLPQLGAALGFAYGLSNHLDLSCELMVHGSAVAHVQESAAVIDGGRPQRGVLSRRTSGARLLVGPVWRLGVAWVPIVAISAGLGGRVRSAGVLQGTGLVPMGEEARLGFELAAAARLGLEHRVSRRITVGVYAQAGMGWGPGQPMAASLAGAFGISYVHYPSWPAR